MIIGLPPGGYKYPTGLIHLDSVDYSKPEKEPTLGDVFTSITKKNEDSQADKAARAAEYHTPFLMQTLAKVKASAESGSNQVSNVFKDSGLSPTQRLDCASWFREQGMEVYQDTVPKAPKKMFGGPDPKKPKSSDYLVLMWG